MNVFEFILIPSSIIVGLGIAELFGGVVRVLRGELKAGGLHSVWVTLVFLQQVQWLWSSWALEGRDAWLFPEFFVFIIGPIGLYMAAALLFPATNSEESLDQHLWERQRPFFFIMALTLASFAVASWIVVAGPLRAVDVPRLMGIAWFGVLAVTRHRGFHWVAAIVTFGIQLWFIYTFTFEVG